MKKAYVKVKSKSATSILKRPYIAATIIGAAICAIALSFVVKPPETDKTEKGTTLSAASSVPEAEASKAPAPPKETPQKQAPAEVTAPARQEVTNPDTNEVAAVVPEEDASVSVGLFGKTADVKFVKPVDAEIIKAYSGTKPVKSKTLGDWRIHSGIDIKAEKGTEVKAPADGKVISAAKDGLTGYTISIDHGNGIISTVYNLESTDKVTEGQEVKAGDVIGTAGTSAASELLDDPHIHFEVTVSGEFVNPEEYLK